MPSRPPESGLASMEYVPALCAAGTIGIAPAGLALGRPDAARRPSTLAYQRASFFAGEPDCSSLTALPSPPSARRRLPLPFSPLLDQSRACTADHARSRSATTTTTTTYYPLDEELSVAARLDALIQRTDEKILLRPRRENNLTVLTRDVDSSPCLDPHSVPSSGRPSSSWVRRLSSITSSVYGSSAASSRPQSPSVNSSNAPFFPLHHQRPGTASNPNKLVKRSTSRHGLPESAYDTAPPLARPLRSNSILRRPATSHQRAAAAMRQRSATESRVESLVPASTVPPPSSSPSPRDGDQPVWRPYFRGIASNFSSLRTRRRSSSVRQRRERSNQHLHLLLEPDILPTLVLSSSVKPYASLHSRFNAPETSSSDPRGHLSRESSSNTHRDTHNTITARQGQHQSSKFSPVDQAPSNRPTEPWEESIAKLQRRQRASLDLKRANGQSDGELPRTSKSERLSGSSMRLRRRKNITDPDIFQRPTTSYHAPDDLPRSISTPQKPSQDDAAQKPRLRHSPQFKDLRYEVLNERRSAPSSASGSRQSSAEQRIYASRDRDQRHSAAVSDPASTIPGSDNDTRIFSSGEEDETDFHSETAFDSFPTRATSSHKSVSRGPRVDTIFDQLDATATTSRGGSDAPGGCARNVSPPETAHKPAPEVRRISPTPKSLVTGPQRASRKANGHPAPSADSAEKLRLYAESPDGEDEFPMTLGPAPVPRPAATLPRASEAGSRMSVFDWSEQQKPTKDSDRSVYRPKTAHEKKAIDSRGGRAAARSAPNTLHLRSQSVPIAKESTGQKDGTFPLKFGTWGLGNKGPSEDWDGDFDFEDAEDQPIQGALDGGLCFGSSMKVPQSILDRQESVHGQYGHVQELTVLVEELKRLQVQAKSLHILDGQSGELWKEAQGIINLATLEEEDEARLNGCKHTRQRSSSSTTFDWGPFGLESSPEPPSVKQTSENLSKLSLSLSGKENSDPSPNLHATFPTSKKSRRDSSAKAKSVLDNIYNIRELHDVNSTTPLAANDTQQRFAFDTQSLRDLVIRAGVITRSLKDIVRKAEGVYVPPEPTHPTPDPPFSQIFVHPSSSSQRPQPLTTLK